MHPDVLMTIVLGAQVLLTTAGTSVLVARSMRSDAEPEWSPEPIGRAPARGHAPSVTREGGSA